LKTNPEGSHPEPNFTVEPTDKVFKTSSILSAENAQLILKGVFTVLSTDKMVVYSAKYLFELFYPRTAAASQGGVKGEGTDSKSIEQFIEDLTFSPSYDLAPPPPPYPLTSQKFVPLSQSPVCRRSSLLTGEGGRSQIKRRRESLVLYKSFNTLWPWLSKCRGV
jgi:hypothetical protein